MCWRCLNGSDQLDVGSRMCEGCEMQCSGARQEDGGLCLTVEKESQLTEWKNVFRVQM